MVARRDRRRDRALRRVDRGRGAPSGSHRDGGARRWHRGRAGAGLGGGECRGRRGGDRVRRRSFGRGTAVPARRARDRSSSCGHGTGHASGDRDRCGRSPSRAGRHCGLRHRDPARAPASVAVRQLRGDPVDVRPCGRSHDARPRRRPASVAGRRRAGCDPPGRRQRAAAGGRRLLRLARVPAPARDRVRAGGRFARGHRWPPWRAERSDRLDAHTGRGRAGRARHEGERGARARHGPRAGRADRPARAGRLPALGSRARPRGERAERDAPLRPRAAVARLVGRGSARPGGCARRTDRALRAARGRRGLASARRDHGRRGPRGGGGRPRRLTLVCARARGGRHARGEPEGRRRHRLAALVRGRARHPDPCEASAGVDARPPATACGGGRGHVRGHHRHGAVDRARLRLGLTRRASRERRGHAGCGRDHVGGDAPVCPRSAPRPGGRSSCGHRGRRARRRSAARRAAVDRADLRRGARLDGGASARIAGRAGTRLRADRNGDRRGAARRPSGRAAGKRRGGCVASPPEPQTRGRGCAHRRVRRGRMEVCDRAAPSTDPPHRLVPRRRPGRRQAAPGRGGRGRALRRRPAGGPRLPEAEGRRRAAARPDGRDAPVARPPGRAARGPRANTDAAPARERLRDARSGLQAPPRGGRRAARQARGRARGPGTARRPADDSHPQPAASRDGGTAAGRPEPVRRRRDRQRGGLRPVAVGRCGVGGGPAAAAAPGRGDEGLAPRQRGSGPAAGAAATAPAGGRHRGGHAQPVRTSGALHARRADSRGAAGLPNRSKRDGEARARSAGALRRLDLEVSAQAASTFRTAGIRERFVVPMVVDGLRRGKDLLERDVELRSIGTLVERAGAGEGGLVVLQGHAGVGKTELLRAASDLGDAAGLRVLRARGSELDRAFAFGLVRQLFEREVAEHPQLLTRGAEPAAAVFPVRRHGAARADEPLFSSLQALQWLVENLAGQAPLLLIADDIHWADAESLRRLVFLAERIEDVAALLVVAMRPAEPGADQELLDALMVTPAACVLSPAPLSAEATTTVVRGHLPQAVDSFSAACHRATGGNPFLLGELLGELAADGVQGAAVDSQRVLEFGPERVGRAVRRRLRGLPPGATALARAVAILGPGTPLEEAAERAGADLGAAATAADALVGIHVLAADRVLDFVHPVVLSAVYDQIPPLERQALHVAAAEQLMAHGVETERVARHLMRLPPSGRPARVALLRAAARHASARGAAEAAALYLRRALEEPPPADERSAVLCLLGVAEATDRQRARFEPHLREAMAVTKNPRARGYMALHLGRALAACGDFRAAVDVLDEALRNVEDPDSDLAISLDAELMAMAFHEFTATDLAAPRVERRLAQCDAGEELDPRTLAPLVWGIAASRGPAAAAIDLAERVLAASRLDEPNSVIGGCLANALIYAGTPKRATRYYDASLATATRLGSRLTVAWQVMMRGDASLRLGETRRAEAEARFGFEYFEADGGEPGFAWGVAHLVDALLARGAPEEADEFVQGAPLSAGAPPTLPVALFHTSRANLHLARGRTSEALSDALAAGDLVSAIISNPAAVRWREPAALALARLDRGEEARGMAEGALADGRRFGIPDAEGNALRTLGLVVGGPDAIDALRASVDVLERAEGRLEHARSVLELGSALRRTGERVEARDVLRTALDMTARMGASGLADRAHEELVAAGARPRRDRRMLSGRESLTASEDRVAALAADGLTNREIAQRQFATVKAVEWHLRNVYRKLDIGSRAQRPEALAL